MLTLVSGRKWPGPPIRNRARKLTFDVRARLGPGLAKGGFPELLRIGGPGHERVFMMARFRLARLGSPIQLTNRDGQYLGIGLGDEAAFSGQRRLHPSGSPSATGTVGPGVMLVCICHVGRSPVVNCSQIDVARLRLLRVKFCLGPRTAVLRARSLQSP